MGEKMQFPKADYRDCLEVAAAIAESVECYDSDDILEPIVPHLQPLIGERDQLRRVVSAMRKELHFPIGQGRDECTHCFGIGLVGDDGTACQCVRGG